MLNSLYIVVYTAIFFLFTHASVRSLYCIVTISATDGSDFAGFLLRNENSVGTFSVSSDDTRTACSVNIFVRLVRHFKQSQRVRDYGFW